MSALLWALRTLRREWYAGELAALWLSLCVAVAALTTVGFLVDRIGHAVALQASEVLAADMRIEASEPIPPAEESQAQQAGLATAQLTSMLTAVFHGDTNQLTSVRAVTAGYPLRGHVQAADRPFGIPTLIQSIPAPGEAWPDSRLAATLGVGIGGVLNVGASSLRVTRIVISRPDQSATFVDLAPTLLVNAADLPATRLIQPGSRVEYNLLLAGDRSALAKFRRWWTRQPSATREHAAGASDASPQIGDASQRAAQFLAFASLAATLLCAVSIAISARSYVRRHLDVVALMKTLGATRRRVLATILWQLVLLALAATFVGAATGWAAHLWLVRVLHGVLRTDLPPASAWPALVALVVALAMLIGFALPSLWQLTGVSALRVLRRDVGPPSLALWLAAAPAVLAIAGVVYALLGEVRLSAEYLFGLGAVIFALAFLGSLLVWFAARLRGGAGASWRYGIAHLARQRVASVAQIVAFGLAGLLLMTLAILRTDLVSEWRQSLPADVPNYFFVNIAAEQREDFTQTIAALGGRVERLLPIVKGRLVAINGEDTHSLPSLSPRGRRAVEREQNITWMSEPGDDNQVIDGHWWTPAQNGQALVSLAEEYRAALGVKLGDRLRFEIGGQALEVTISSFRKVKWDSFRPNFFIVIPPGLLDPSAGTYMTSAHLQPDGASIARLAQRFPEVSIFNVGEILAQVRAMIDKAVAAVQIVFLFTLLAGLAVLFAAVQSSRDERWHEAAILRALGARRSMLRNSALVEFTLIGLVAGVLAASGAALAGIWFASTLNLHYRFNLALWWQGTVATTLIVAAAGWLSTRRVVQVPPREALG